MKLQLTDKGKEVYGDYEIATSQEWITGPGMTRSVVIYILVYDEGNFIIALNPLELKALIDLGLVEIK